MPPPPVPDPLSPHLSTAALPISSHLAKPRRDDSSTLGDHGLTIPQFVFVCIVMFLALLIFLIWLTKHLRRTLHSPSSPGTSILDDSPHERQRWHFFGRSEAHGQSGAQAKSHNLTTYTPTPAPSLPQPGDPPGDHELSILPPHLLRHEYRAVSGDNTTLPLASSTAGTYLETAEKAIVGLKNMRLDTIRATSSPIPTTNSKSEHLPELILVPTFERSDHGVNKLAKPNPLSNITQLKPPNEYPHDFEVREDKAATENNEGVIRDSVETFRTTSKKNSEALALNERSSNRVSSSATVIRVDQFDIKRKEGVKGKAGDGEGYKNFSVPMKLSLRGKEARMVEGGGRERMSEDDYEADMF